MTDQRPELPTSSSFEVGLSALPPSAEPEVGESQASDKGLWLGAIAIVLWSTTVACSRSLTEQLGVFSAGAAVYLSAGILGCGTLAARGRLRSLLRTADRRYLLGCGGLMFVYTLLLFAAIGLAKGRGQVVTATAANYLWPSLTLLLAGPILGLPTRYAWVAGGTLTGVAGVLLTAGGGPDLWAGHLGKADAIAGALGALAALCWALYSNLARRWGAGAGDGAMPVFILATGLGLWLLRSAVGEETLWSWRAALEVGYVAVFPTLLAYGFWDFAMRHSNVSLLASASYLIPALSVAVSWLYLRLAISPLQWLGVVLVIAAAVLCRLGTRA